MSCDMACGEGKEGMGVGMDGVGAIGDRESVTDSRRSTGLSSQGHEARMQRAVAERALELMLHKRAQSERRRTEAEKQARALTERKEQL